MSILLVCALLAIVTVVSVLKPLLQSGSIPFASTGLDDAAEAEQRSLELMAELRHEEQLGRVSSSEAQRIVKRSQS